MNILKKRLTRRSLGVLVVLLLVLAFLSYMMKHYSPQRNQKPESTPNIRRTRKANNYLLNQKNCKISKVPLNSDVYWKLYKKGPLEKGENHCEDVDDFAKIRNNVVTLTDHNSWDQCCVHEIQRPQELRSDKYILGDCVKLKNNKLNVSGSEAMRITCMHTSDPIKARTNILLNTAITTGWPISAKKKFWDSRGGQNPPSVFWLVLDSSSRNDVDRDLPKTKEFLLNTLGFTEFQGHHPLAEPTMTNALALLTGMKPTELWESYLPSTSKFWDSVPFIWKEFHRLHYITGYLEDMPEVGTFNYGQRKGFLLRPTDLYMRPLTTAHRKAFKTKRKRICYGRKEVVEFFLDYILDILEDLRGVPSFLINWPCWPQHNYPGGLKFQDDVYLNFFQRFSKDPAMLDNTVFIVMSDHGFYQGKYAHTHHGLLERRSLPLMIRFPPKLERDFPLMMGNLQGNTEAVTSHFDVHRTVLHLAELFGDEVGIKGVNGSKLHGQSLLEKLPANRTCEEAGIPSSFCACNLPAAVDDQTSVDVDLKEHPELKIKRKEIFNPY